MKTVKELSYPMPKPGDTLKHRITLREDSMGVYYVVEQLSVNGIWNVINSEEYVNALAAEGASKAFATAVRNECLR